jgi:MFS family permease
MAGTIGPVAAVVVDVSQPEWRATASAVLSVTQNLIGLAGGPLLTGALSDRFGLQAAMGSMPLFCIAAAALFLLASRTYERDLQRVADSNAGARLALQPQGA